MEKEARESSVRLGFVSRREEIKACCQNTESISEGSLQGAIFFVFFLLLPRSRKKVEVELMMTRSACDLIANCQ